MKLIKETLGIKLPTFDYQNNAKKVCTYSFPLRSRLNNLPEDPEAANPVTPGADAAENDANDPDDNAFSPGVPELVDPCPDEL